MEKEEENNNKIKKTNIIKLSRIYRLFLFFIMINIDGTMDISSGIFSSASKHLHLLSKAIIKNDNIYIIIIIKLSFKSLFCKFIPICFPYSQNFSPSWKCESRK